MDSRSNTAFLGDQTKFKQREDLMAKSRAKGDTKIAGRCLQNISISRSLIHLTTLTFLDIMNSESISFIWVDKQRFLIICMFYCAI